MFAIFSLNSRNLSLNFRLKWLKRIRREKELELGEENPKNFIHSGYKCDGCGMDPIQGGRFTCSDCFVDFCLECAPKNLDIEQHDSKSHKLRAVRKKIKTLLASSSTADSDYLFHNNYLDPNFVN